MNDPAFSFPSLTLRKTVKNSFFLWRDEKWYAGLDRIAAMPESTPSGNNRSRPPCTRLVFLSGLQSSCSFFHQLGGIQKCLVIALRR